MFMCVSLWVFFKVASKGIQVHQSHRLQYDADIKEDFLLFETSLHIVWNHPFRWKTKKISIAQYWRLAPRPSFELCLFLYLFSLFARQRMPSCPVAWRSDTHSVSLSQGYFKSLCLGCTGMDGYRVWMCVLMCLCVKVKGILISSHLR